MLLLIASIIIGIGIGLLLSKIAFEELEESKKYILLLKRIIFLGVVILSSYLLFLNFNVLLLVIILILVIKFIFEIKTKNIKLEIVNYILFSIIYFLINNEYNIQDGTFYILVSLILFYGIPLGSLIHLHFIGEGKEDKKDKKDTKEIIKKIKKSHKKNE